MTHRRGSADTLQRDIWGGAEPSGRPLVVMLLLALVLHLPAVPTRLSLWVSYFIPSAPAPEGPQQGFVLPIDVDLLSEEAPPKEEPKDPPPKDQLAEKALDADPTDSDDIDEDAFFDDEAPEETAPKTEPDVATPEPSATEEAPEAPAPPPPKADLPEGKLRDTFSAAGAAGAVRARHPNVNVYLASDLLRRSKISDKFAGLLANIPQWKQLIGGTGLDPMRDFDRILISGPQFRNPQWIVVAIKFNTTAKRIKKALDAVIKRDGGKAKWIDPLTARIGKKGDRYAVLVPNKRTLWILPATQKDDLNRVREAGAFAQAPAAGMVIDLKDPANAFRAAPFKFPATISHIRMHFMMGKGGRYKVVAEGWDKSRGEAKKHAAFFETALEAADLGKQASKSKVLKLLKMDKVVAKVKLIGDTKFEVKGKRIVATADVTDKQLLRIMSLVELDQEAREDAAKERRKKAAEAKKKLDEAGKNLDATKKVLERLQRGRLAGVKPKGKGTTPAKESPVTPPPTDAPKGGPKETPAPAVPSNP